MVVEEEEADEWVDARVELAARSSPQRIRSTDDCTASEAEQRNAASLCSMRATSCLRSWL